MGDVTVWNGLQTPESQATLARERGRAIHHVYALPSKYVHDGYANRIRPEELGEEDEQAIIKHLAEYPKTVARAAEVLEPHRIASYLEELARLVNGWYHRHRVVGSGGDLERAVAAYNKGVELYRHGAVVAARDAWREASKLSKKSRVGRSARTNIRWIRRKRTKSLRKRKPLAPPEPAPVAAASSDSSVS